MCVALSAIGCAANDDMSDLPSTEQIVIASEPDLFSEPVTLADAAGAPLQPVHATLMRDGRVLLIGKEGNAGLLTPAPPQPAVALGAAVAPVEVSGQVFDNRYYVADSWRSSQRRLFSGS